MVDVGGLDEQLLLGGDPAGGDQLAVDGRFQKVAELSEEGVIQEVVRHAALGVSDV